MADVPTFNQFDGDDLNRRTTSIPLGRDHIARFPDRFFPKSQAKVLHQTKQGEDEQENGIDDN